ncbi:unnamed protein product [Brachionus calyciflorus]|uniref:Peroxisomal multifunctional enzyme type 2 n=1 Tax=Brachionus calyciflorus TaxID=104777 RepID=A0A813LY12_9BILA|nr:unnamed protein product [Brachionus calyciflorus]
MSNDQLRFDGKVVIVTGAGGGLGKCYALSFAERGAKVVVNDLGGSMSGGDGKSTKAADVVVEEIRAKNGIAVPNYDSVEDAEKIIQTAIDNFGRIDILVNNAGILRDRSFLKTTDLDWDLIHRIHLRASFLLTRAAWPHMQKNKFGRVIMTSSGAGIYGNFGQANYSAAKLGLLGLSNTLSIEGQKYNIKCNTIAPVAKSRLTETVMPEEILNVLKPEFVSPLVLYLCHENTNETGSLFEVGGGWVGKLRWQKSSGAVVRNGDLMTPEDVRDNWTKITSFDVPLYHTAIAESTNFCLNASENASSETPSSATSDDTKFKYDFKDVILYALSLGVSTSNEKSLKFLYENHEDFSVLPSYGVIPAFGILFNALSSLKLPNNLTIDPAKILHGEHYLELAKPLSTSGSLTIKPKLVDVLDKGSGALLIINIELLDEKNELVALNQFVTFSVGSGNFGGKRDSDKLVKVTSKKFDRKADRVVEEKTTVDQAALYRLNGDLNPLHIDPSFSAILGFNKPILHGLCSFGFAVKHIIQTYCDNDVKLFKSVKVRFSKPVLPGQTIQTNMWLEKEEKKVYFECRVVEDQTVVISGAYVQLHDVKLAGEDKKPVETEVSKPAVDFACDKIFSEISNKLSQSPEISKSINAVYMFRVTKGDLTKVYLVDLKKNKLTNHSDKEEIKAECTITISDDDFIGLATGKSNPQQMFMKGKLKVKGNIMLAQKLEKLFKTNAKL